jgi:uncharacterized SAM-binding protein YcdF (DUF218 family)
MKPFHKKLLVSVAFIAALAIVGFIRAGEFLSSPASAPRHADVILALGGDNGDRVALAVKLYKEGMAPRIMLTGLENSYKESRPDYLNWRVQFLYAHGVPKEAVILESAAGNSWEEAVNTLNLLKQHEWKTVLVVSDPPHMRRLNWAWGKVFGESGREYILVSTTPAWWEAAHWWRHEQAGPFVLMEYTKLAYYILKY